MSDGAREIGGGKGRDMANLRHVQLKGVIRGDERD